MEQENGLKSQKHPGIKQKEYNKKIIIHEIRDERKFWIKNITKIFKF